MEQNDINHSNTTPTNPPTSNSKKTYVIILVFLTALILGLIGGIYGYGKWLRDINTSNVNISKVNTNTGVDTTIITKTPVSFPYAELTEPGDKIGDFTVTRINYYSPTRDYPYPLITANFTGETTISGPFGYNEIQGFCFNIESGNTPEFKEFVDVDYQGGGVCLRDSDNSFKLVTGRDIPRDAGYPSLEMGSWGKATIVIKDYEMYRDAKDGAGDGAILVRVVELSPNP